MGSIDRLRQDVFTCTIEGFDEFIDTIDQLVDSVKPSIVEPELQKGAQIMAKEMRKRAPVRKQERHNRGGIGPQKAPGVLKRAIRTKRLDLYGTGPATYIAAIDRRKAPHAWLVVHGTSGVRKVDPPRWVVINDRPVLIRHTGVMPPNRFVDDAYQAKKDQVLNNIATSVGKSIEEAMK
jgi:HK97 gp10 family phage protein